MRRTSIVVLGLSLALGFTGSIVGQTPATPDASTVHLVGGVTMAGSPRSVGRSPVRRYRSYSVEPATPIVTDGPIVGAPRTVGPAPSTGRSGKPSYMRADSKARGRFHQ